MTPEERAAVRRIWLANLQAEIDRRRAIALVAAGDNPRAALLLVFEGMNDRLRADPDFREPAPSLQRRDAKTIEGWLRRHGYGLDAD